MRGKYHMHRVVALMAWPFNDIITFFFFFLILTKVRWTCSKEAHSRGASSRPHKPLHHLTYGASIFSPGSSRLNLVIGMNTGDWFIARRGWGVGDRSCPQTGSASFFATKPRCDDWSSSINRNSELSMHINHRPTCDVPWCLLNQSANW